MTVKLSSPAGGVIEVGDDVADRFIAAGYTELKPAKTKTDSKPDPKPAKRRKGE